MEANQMLLLAQHHQVCKKNAQSHNQLKNTLLFYFFTEGFGLSRHLSSSTPQIGTPQQRFLNCVLNIKS